jgi:predicted ribonuclease YlaK
MIADRKATSAHALGENIGFLPGTDSEETGVGFLLIIEDHIFLWDHLTQVEAEARD